jgi:hypothetical protein
MKDGDDKRDKVRLKEIAFAAYVSIAGSLVGAAHEAKKSLLDIKGHKGESDAGRWGMLSSRRAWRK